MPIWKFYLKCLFCSFLGYTVQVGRTLSERRWKAAISEDGHVDIVGVLRRIQRGVKHLFLACIHLIKCYTAQPLSVLIK